MMSVRPSPRVHILWFLDLSKEIIVGFCDPIGVQKLTAKMFFAVEAQLAKWCQWPFCFLQQPYLKWPCSTLCVNVVCGERRWQGGCGQLRLQFISTESFCLLDSITLPTFLSCILMFYTCLLLFYSSYIYKRVAGSD